MTNENNNAAKEYKISSHYPCGLRENPSRLAIFSYYDKDGVIDDYIPYLLNDLSENLTKLVVVINGDVNPEGLNKLKKITPYIYMRTNGGFDAAAWKEAMLDYLGWDEVANYDELILLNDTFFGPFYPFKDVFAEMNRQPVDFWGLTVHSSCEIKLEKCPYPNVPEHIQTYFLAIRKEMHTSYEFKQYWEQQPIFTTQNELFEQNEVVFTKHFSDAGYCYNVFVDTRDIDNPVMDHHMFNTYELIRYRKYPVLKRRNFGFDFAHHLAYTNGMQLSHSLEYIRDEYGYDTSLIYQNIARVFNVTDIFNNLHLNYVLPKTYNTSDSPSQNRAVVVFHTFYMDLLDYIASYLSNVPETIDVILTTQSKENVEILQRYFSPILGKRLRVLESKNPGRDLSALLVTASPYLRDYDYFCFCHDKRSHNVDPVTMGSGFLELIIENTLGSSRYIENVIALLDAHPEIGLLSTPTPNHSLYFEGVLKYPWTVCFAIVNGLAERLGIKTIIDENKPPLAIGTAFWCRRDALAPLLDYPWKYDDFPPEPLPIDGTLNHALERIFPYVAQHQGYLTGWIMTDEYASTEINNIHCRLREMIYRLETATAIQPTGIPEPVIVNIGVKGALSNYIKKHLPKSLWGIARKAKQLLRW